MPELNLPGHIEVLPNRDALFTELAQHVMHAAQEAVRDRGVFHIALSGGSTPEPFYMMLCTDTRWRSIPWNQAHIWLVDERRVAEDDAKSNMKMIRESLTDQIPISHRHIHAMPVLEDDPATLYEKQFEDTFGFNVASGKVPQIDFILLGMGDDGHTASIFPKSDAVHVHDRWVFANDGPHVTPPPRLTLTYPVINAGRSVAVLAVGGKKAPTLQRVSEQLAQHGPDPENLPITGIHPSNLTWFLDEAAAASN